MKINFFFHKISNPTIFATIILGRRHGTLVNTPTLGEIGPPEAS